MARAPQPLSVALAEMKGDFSRYLRLAVSEEIVITRHGRPAGVLIGFESEEDWFEYRLEHHPEFLRQIRQARSDLASGKGIRLARGHAVVGAPVVRPRRTNQLSVDRDSDLLSCRRTLLARAS